LRVKPEPGGFYPPRSRSTPEFVASSQKLSFTGKVSFSLKKIYAVHKFFFYFQKYFSNTINGRVTWTSVLYFVVLVLGILIRGYFIVK
jgi:hypothetical protein